ncbi:MAG: protease inhibitor I9 family protein [Alphaproteobacteria bacterium]
MTAQEKSYIVTLNDNQDMDKTTAEIEKMAKSKKDTVKIGSKMKIIGVFQMSCKDSFAKAVRKMPAVLAVEEERTMHASKKGSGPSI